MRKDAADNNLFAATEEANLASAAPLAARMRPETMEQFVGQRHFLSPGKLLWRMLQADKPNDLVLATGETHSVEEFCLAAFKCVGMPLEFHGAGVERQGVDGDGNVRVQVDPNYFRPTEVDLLVGDASTSVIEVSATRRPVPPKHPRQCFGR